MWIMRDSWVDESWPLLKLLLSKCLGVELDGMGALQSQHKRKASEFGMLNILAYYIRGLSRLSNFHSYIQWLGWCLGCLEVAKSVSVT